MNKKYISASESDLCVISRAIFCWANTIMPKRTAADAIKKLSMEEVPELWRALKEKGEIEDIVAGKTIVAKYITEIESVRLFEKNDDKLTLLSPISAYWFSWASVHPDTEVYN